MITNTMVEMSQDLKGQLMGAYPYSESKMENLAKLNYYVQPDNVHGQNWNGDTKNGQSSIKGQSPQNME